MQLSGSDTAGAARKGSPTPSARLLTRLRAMGLPVPEGASIERTHAGHWQRKEGAWSWQVLPQLGREGVGSQYPVTKLLHARRLIAIRHHRQDDYHLFAWQEGWAVDYRDVLEPEPCPGSGQRWATGTGRPMCPVCHRQARSLDANPVRRSGQGWSGEVPSHPAKQLDGHC